MRNHSYEVQKGNQVLPTHVGKNVTWQKAETIGEALGLPTDVGQRISQMIADATKTTTNPHFENEQALVAAAEQQRDIAVREDIRAVLSKPEGTLDGAAKVANELTIGAPRSGSGRVSKTAKPATQQARAEKDVGNKIFERALVDEKFRSQMAKAGFLDGFDAWQAAREAAQAAKSEPKAEAKAS